MKNYVQTGDILTLSAPADVSSGGIVVVGTLVGVAQVDAVAGDPVAVVRRGVFADLPKKTGEAWAVGDKLYWNATDGHMTKTATGAVLVGCAVATVVAAGETGSVFLDGVIR